MLKIKLAPRGKKHQISYRVVVANDRSKLDGAIIDDIGFYTPQTNTIEIDKKKMDQWQKNGAQLTLGVDKLLNPKKYPNKKKNKKEEKEESKKDEPKAEEINKESIPENNETKVEEVKEKQEESGDSEVKEEKEENK